MPLETEREDGETNLLTLGERIEGTAERGLQRLV